MKSQLFRPQLLLITNLPSCHESNQEETTRKLLHLASQLKKGRGLTIAVSLRGGDPTDSDEKAVFFEAFPSFFSHRYLFSG